MEQHDQNPNLSSLANKETEFTGSRIETAPVEPATAQTEHQQNGSTEDDISYEERAQFAGVDTDYDDELVTTDELIDGPSTARERGVENSPLSRLGFVTSALGVIVIVIWIFSGFFTGNSQQAQEQDNERPLPSESAASYGADDQMRAELALVEQERSQPQQRLAETPQQPTPEAEESSTEASEPPPTTPTQVVRSQPTPAPIPAPTRPIASPPREPVAASPTPISSRPSEDTVDPLEQWTRLSTAGAAGAEVALGSEPAIGASEANWTQATPNSPEADQQSASLSLPTDTIGDAPIPLPIDGDTRENTSALQMASQQQQNPDRDVLVSSLTPGAQGIIQQRPITAAEEDGTDTTEVTRRRQVAIGTSTTGEVIVPVIYAGGELSAQGRFAIELSEPLMDINGQVALEAGTVLITQLTEILDANILRQQVVAVVYRDAEDQVRQETVEPGVLIVRGENNRPLVAQVRNDDGSRDFGEDLLVGTLSALGNIGAVLNAPDAVTTATSEAGENTTTRTSTTVTSGQDDNVVAAALDGFFTPVSERVINRFEEQNQTPSSPYLFVPEGQEVSIFANGLLEVIR